MSKIQKDNAVEKIIVKYNDGTEKEITKGLIITDKVNENEEHNLTFEFANMAGKELSDIVLGVMQMGSEMGMFNDIEDED